MPAVLTTFSDNEISVKWQEQYVSEALNRDMAALAAKGVHRGFVLSTSGTALAVSVLADAAGDHAAGLPTSTGNLLGIKRTGGTFTLVLTPYAGKTVVIALYATYAAGAPTVAEIRAYELSPSDEFTVAVERPYLIPIGRVKVPASGTIPAADITGAYRIEAWEGSNLFAHPPQQLLQNGGFELCFADTYKHESTPHWTKATTDLETAASFFPSAVSPASGGLYHLRADYAGSAVSSQIAQNLFVPCVAGQTFRVRAKIRQVAVATAGTFTANFDFVQADGDTSVAVVVSISMATASGAYTDFDTVVTAPAGAQFLRSFGFALTGVTLASNGAIVYIDDVELWQEPQVGKSRLQGTPYAAARDIVTAALALFPTWQINDTYLDDFAKSLLIRRGSSTTAELSVFAGRVDGNDESLPPPILNWVGRMEVGANKYSKSNPHIHTWHATGQGNTPLNMIWQSQGGDPLTGSGYSETQARLYVNSTTGALMLTVNARAQESSFSIDWVQDDDTKASYRMYLGDNTAANTQSDHWPQFNYVAAGTSAWAENQWECLYVGGEERARSIAYTGPVGSTLPYGVSVALVNTTGGAVAITLPAASLMKNRIVTFKDVGGALSTNALTINRTGSETIEGVGAPFVCEANGARIRVYCDGSNFWFI